MKQIICLSTSNWHPFPTRKQQVMGRLKDAQILYFDPPVTYLAPFKDKTLRERLHAFQRSGEKIKENLTVYAMPPVLPFFNKFRFINRLNGKKQARFVRKIMKKHGFENPVLWCYSPSAADIEKSVPHSAVIYDCVDRHSAYKGMINPRVVDRMEKELASAADMVFCTAKGLEKTLREYNAETHLIPNGANFELFSQVSAPSELLAPPPDDLFNVRSPILGFVGMLQECIDYGLLQAAAQAHPEWSFVLIGKAQPDVDLSFLSDYRNIHLLGLKPHKELPQYLALFDVCLNLFRSGDLSKDVSPLKFYEYLATGKPVVSTPQPEQVLEYEDVVYIAGTPREFIKKCEIAVSEHDAWKVRRRLEYGREASWDARVAAMEKLLKQKGIF